MKHLIALLIVIAAGMLLLFLSGLVLWLAGRKRMENDIWDGNSELR